MKKKILILTASYGEGHNSAARGLRDGLLRVSPEAVVEIHDLFVETYGCLNELIRKAYLGVINRWPRSWGYVYRWLEQKKDFEHDFRRFGRLQLQLKQLVERFRPDAIVSVFPAYPYFLRRIFGPQPNFRNIVVVTDSITVNAIWYRCAADYFLLPNEESASVLRAAGVRPELIKIFGFPVNPQFADFSNDRLDPAPNGCRVLYMINPATLRMVGLVDKLLDLDLNLTVTVGRNEKLRRRVAAIAASRPIQILGWTDQLPRLLHDHHLLLGKAGGATVQEAIAAACPMIINHVVSGQEEGNAQLIVESGSGAIVHSAVETVACIKNAFTNDAAQWRSWQQNISRMSRPDAAVAIAKFLLSL